MSYRVSTQVYSGPFDLLLQLVTRQKVDIGAISISEVAEQYLAEAERIEALDLDVASDFLLVAATLLDIKAASLVPQEAPRKADDDDDEFDEDLEELSTLDGDALREVLIQRLIAYKQFKGAAAALGARHAGRKPHAPACGRPRPRVLGLGRLPGRHHPARPRRHLRRPGRQAPDLPAGGRARGTASRAARPDGGLGRPLYHGAPNLHLPRATGRRCHYRAARRHLPSYA